MNKKIILLGGVWFRFFFFCFKQLPLNIKQNFEFSYHLIDGERLSSVVLGLVNSNFKFAWQFDQYHLEFL